jgi:hypothetical protein
VGHDGAIRASDSDRESVVEILRQAYTDGRLDLGEFDERTTAAYAAKTWADLRQLTSDLPVDAVLGAIEIPAASVIDAEAIVPGLEHVAGIVRGPDGLVLIEDLEAFLSPDEDRQLARALAEVDR